MTHIICCEPHMNQSSCASLAEVPVTDVLQDSSEGMQILDDLVKAGQRTQWFDPGHRKTRKSKPPARIKPWWPAWCANCVRWKSLCRIFLQEILLFKILVFRTELPPKKSGKHSQRCAGRVRSNSFIHWCMPCLKQFQVFRQAVSHTRMQSNREFVFWWFFKMKLVLLGVGCFFKGYVSFRECNMTETEYFFLEGEGEGWYPPGNGHVPSQTCLSRWFSQGNPWDVSKFKHSKVQSAPSQSGSESFILLQLAQKVRDVCKKRCSYCIGTVRFGRRSSSKSFF